jgi:NAD(P)-dependent dehydrogenase (short-subunit alcohol dehydrogenase family)
MKHPRLRVIMNAETRVAIITGASQGISAGLVRGFRERAYRVVANSRSIEAGAFGDPDVISVAGDIADPRTAERVVAAAVERFGRVDTLVNNAGAFLSRPFTDYTEADFTRLVSVNLAGFFFVSQRAAAHMLRQGGGHIVNITTSMVDQPMAGLPSAMAALTKGGLDAVTRSLAIEYASQGVRVNAVSPGIIKTPMHPAESHEFLARLHPLGRMGEVEDVVDAVLYLESAGFVTGEVLRVDGGQHAGHW